MATELSLEKQKAIAMANARMRMAQAQQQPPEMSADVQTPNIGAKGDKAPGSRVRADDPGPAVLEGALLGFGDEIVAGASAPLHAAKNLITGEGPTSIGENYDQALAQQRAKLDASRQQFPGQTLGAEVGGALMTGKVPASLAFKGGNLATKAVKGAGVGAGYGAIAGYGSGQGQEDRLEKAKSGGKFGAAFGAGAPVVGKVIGKTVNAVTRPKNTAPSMDAIRRSANQAYKEADQSGLVVSQPSYSNAVQDILQTAQREGLDYRIHPKAASALQRLVEVEGGPVSLRELEVLRRVTQSVGKSVEPDERRLAGIIVDKLDDFMLRLGPQDVVAGNPNKAINALFNARSQWSKLKKSETIQEMMERAKTSAPQFSGSGLENAIRTEFRALAKNKKLMRTFTAAEQAAIKRVARGGPVENAMRMLGKFAPTGVVSSALSGGTGFAMGGPVGAVFLPAAGLLARQGATHLTKRNVDMLDHLIRRGGPALVSPKSDFAQKATEQLLLTQSGLAGEMLNGPRERPMRRLPETRIAGQ